MLLETRKFDTASSAAGGEAATLGEIYDATFDSMRLVENANASRVGMERAYDARIDAIFNATGQRLRNPASTAIDHRNPRAGLDLEPFPDLHAEFQKQLEELAANRPEHRAIIAPDRPVIEDAYRRAREADRGFEETWERSSGGAAAWAARLTAGFAGTAADPINVFGLAAGPFGQAGRGTTGLLWMALKSGTANAGVEAAVQPFSQAWRAEAGLPHGLDMAALNIGAAFLFGAGLDAGARSTVRGVRRAIGRPYLGPDPKSDPIAALDAAARNAPEGSLIRRAVEGDEAAMKEIAVKTGLDADPAVRGALTGMETDGLFRGMKPEAVDDGEHLRQLSTALGRAQGEGRLPPGEAVTAPPARPAPDMGDYAPARLGTAETLDGKPVSFVALDPERVVTDATTFQFKSEGDAAGVTARLRGVKRWDPLSAGKSFVFERLNGELVIADGHQRLGLAKRLADQKPQLHSYLFREADGWTPADVRAHAALKNMRELSGTSVDMAKVMRERPDLVDDSLPLSDGKMREAAMLAKLSPEAFGAVVAGRLPATYAALIGDHVTDAGRHAGLLDELARADLANVTQARFFLAQLMELPTTTETQITLFGEEAVTRTVMAERAKVLDASLRALRGDKRIFGLLEREARRIAEGGNVLDRESNAARAQNAAELAELIERLSTTRGVVATLLNDAATAVARGFAPALAARAFTRRIGDLLDAEGINGLLKAADEPPAGGRIDDPNGPEVKAQVDELQARQDADQEVMFALPETEREAPRTNAAGYTLRMPFKEKWGDPRFNLQDRERALAALHEAAGINVQRAPWETLVQARRDIGEIASQLLYYADEVPDEDIINPRFDEVTRYMFDKRHGQATGEGEGRRFSIFAETDEVPADIRDISTAGRRAIEHLLSGRRNGMHDLINYADFTEPAKRPKVNDPTKIADKRGGFFFASARELANMPDSLFHQGGQAIINALEQAGVKRAEITHLGLKVLADQKPVTRAAFEELIADNEFQFRRKTSWLNPERSKRDYELGGTRAFTGPRIPGRGVYFERLMAFPKRLKGGGDFAPGHFQSPHWEEIMKGTWASWRGSVRDLPSWGKTVIGEEGQTDFMQGAFGRGDNWTGRRPRIAAKDYLALKKERSKFEAAQHSAYLEMVHIGQQIGLSWDVRRSLEGDLRSGDWEKMLSDTHSLIKDWGNGDPGKIKRQDAMDAGLDKIADIIARDPQYFAADATKKFAKTESSFTPASPLDQSYVRTMARDLLLHASKEDADAVAIATSETTNRIQANTTASAAHFYDAQMKPSLEKELRRITGDGSITLEKVELEKALGAPKREKAYTVWAAKLSPETRAKINEEGLPLFSLATFAPQPVLSRSAPSVRYAAAAAIRADIDKAVNKMLPPSWRHEVRDTLVYGGRQVKGYADPYERIIYVSLAATDPLERTFEESGHALRSAGLIPAADYNILRIEGQRLGARAHFEIDARYGETYGRRWQGAALEDRLEEEAIMQMIAAHARGKTFGEPSSAARRILDRIVKFLRGVGEMLRGRGFRTYEDVFDGMVSGRMARPEPLPEIAGGRSADEGGDTSPAGDAMLSLGEGTPPPDIRDVINGAAAEGRLSRDDATALLGRLEELERHYRDNPAEAAQALRAEVDAEALRRQRLALLTREAHERVENFVEQYRDARGQADPAKATIALLEHHGQTPMPDGASSVVGRRQAIIGMSMAQMEGALHEFRRTWVRGATRNRARPADVRKRRFHTGCGVS